MLIHADPDPKHWYSSQSRNVCIRAEQSAFLRLLREGLHVAAMWLRGCYVRDRGCCMEDKLLLRR